MIMLTNTAKKGNESCFFVDHRKAADIMRRLNWKLNN
jgi:hypothetical protein